MLQDIFSFAVRYSTSSWYAVVLFLCLLTLWCYRIWRFSVRPMFHPSEPLEYPFVIPVVGHLFSFLSDSEALLTSARKYFAPNHSLFMVTVADSSLYVVTDPADVGHVFKNTQKLSFESFLHDIMFEFVTSKEGIRKILGMPWPHERPSTINKSVSQKAHDLQVLQTQGKHLKSLGNFMVESFQRHLATAAISAYRLPSHPSYPDTKDCIISLRKWTTNVFIKVGQEAYFGDALAKIDPGLPQALMKLDELSWQVFYKYPKICRSTLNGLCERILRALRRYIALPHSKRPCAVWFTESLEKEFRDAGLSDEDIATQLLFLYWGINTNISKVGFWIITQMLSNPELISAVRHETTPAFRTDNAIDSTYIYRNCPRLNALWLETLRMSASSTVMREVTSDTILGGKLLRAGNKVLVSARQLHFRAADFGHNVDQFDHNRFLKNPGLEHNPAFRPFGGGPTMCPGRLLAKHMTLNFIALLFHRFDVELDGPQAFPRYIENKPSIGIMGGDGDLRIRLVTRISK